MKKTLLTLAVLLIGLAVKAQDPVASIEFTKNSDLYSGNSGYYGKSGTWQTNDKEWTFVDMNNNNRGWDYIAGGSKTQATNPAFATAQQAMPISKIVANIGGRFTASAITSATLYVADNANFTNAESTALTLPAEKNTEWTIIVPNPTENKYYKVEFVVPKQSSNGQAISFTKIALYGKSDKAEPNYAFSEGSVDLDFGAEFTAPKFTCAEGAPAPTYSSSVPEVATVDAATGAVTIVGAGTTVISATCESTDKFLAGKASYTINVLKVCNSIAEVKELADNTKFRVNFPLTLAFKNGSNNFVCNGDDFIQIYGSTTYKVGDVIPAGWVGTYENYKGNTPEIKDPIDMQPATETEEFVPAEATDFTVADVNKVLMIKNVVFDVATPSGQSNFTGKVGEKEYSLRNNYKLASVAAGTYNVTVLVTIYNNAPSLYVTKYELVDGTVGIADVVVDENAPVEYFNLQGIRVENPENGLFIRRQGNKVTKVIVK